MPIISDKPDSPALPQPGKLEIFEPNHKTPIIDTRYVPRQELITHIEGSAWSVDYYSAVIDSDNDLYGLQTGQLAPYRSYKKIVNFELRVNSPLTHSQDENTNSFEITGGAHVYPVLVPQMGDMFRASTPDGREGLFQITRVERRTYFKDTAHHIEYVMINQSTENHLEDLEKKTIQVYYFVKDFIYHGQNPLLVESEYRAASILTKLYYDVLFVYFKGYYSREYSTMVLPSQTSTVYDHGLTKFIRSAFQNHDSYELLHMRVLNTDDEEVVNGMTLWTLLERKDLSLLRHCATKADLAACRSFSRLPYFGSIRFSGIEYIVYPTDPKLTVDYRHIDRSKIVMGQPLGPSVLRFDEVFRFSQTTNFTVAKEDSEGNELGSPVPGPDTRPSFIKPVTVDEFYVFSEAFYQNQRQDFSLLESLVMDYLEDKQLSVVSIVRLLEQSHNWGDLERFYYLPIVLFLARSKIRQI